MRIKRILLGFAKQALLLIALTATAGTSALLTMRAILAAQEVSVPTLVGRGLAEASGVAGRLRLTVKVEGRRNDPQVPPGHVAAQEPRAGSVLKTQRSVRVWLSAGPERLHVPAVEGQSVRTARLALEQARLPVERVVEVRHPAAADTVIVQRPPAGETDVIAGSVALLVSRGSAAADLVMPDLIGRDATFVIERLRAAGLRVADVRYRAYSGVPAGVVLRQSPPAGRRVRPSDPIGLDVSSIS